MKPILFSLAAVVFMAGCASDCHVAELDSPEDDRIYRNITECGIIPPSPRLITKTETALAHRAAAYNRYQEISAFEASLYDSSESRASGRMAGPVLCQPNCPPNSTMMVPTTGMVPVPEMLAPVQPPPIAECPIATPVLGKPGFVVSPFAPKAGYVDVTGLPPGSEVKDPFTGKTFRIP